MEVSRARGPASKNVKRFLLPVSFGPSSTSLLYILNNHLQAQLDRMNRTSYELVVIHVYPQFGDAEAGLNEHILSEELKSRFPRHTYISAKIEDALDLESIDWNRLGLEAVGDLQKPRTERLQRLAASLPSATSRNDILSTLLDRYLVDAAVTNKCEAILFGDSTTRLAEKTLTETAKGRGFSLPWQVSDGLSTFGINFHYPMRDVLKKEIVTFTSLTTPPLTDLVVQQSSASQISASAKSTTIDDLMCQYFESVEENYPSIVANVVRTSSKLQAPTLLDESSTCGLCGLPVAEGTDGIYGWGGDQNFTSRATEPQSHNRGILCYGCSRSING